MNEKTLLLAYDIALMIGDPFTMLIANKTPITVGNQTFIMMYDTELDQYGFRDENGNISYIDQR